MEGNFSNSLNMLLEHEGGWADHPEDDGGATMKGITLETFRYHFGKSLTKNDLRHITNTQLYSIYENEYWDMCRCDELPLGLDYIVFGSAVHSGTHRATVWLQAALGVKMDGVFGPITLATVLSGDATTITIINRILDMRLKFLRRLDDWEHFGRGWQRRIDEAMANALAMLEDDMAEERIAELDPVLGTVLPKELRKKYIPLDTDQDILDRYVRERLVVLIGGVHFTPSLMVAPLGRTKNVGPGDIINEEDQESSRVKWLITELNAYQGMCAAMAREITALNETEDVGQGPVQRFERYARGWLKNYNGTRAANRRAEDST